jgi:DNA polymerase III subunit delta
MFYILHGDQEFLLSEEIAKLKSQVIEDGMGDLNITELDGRSVTLSELTNVCNTLPFFTQRRLVIVTNLLQRLQGGRSRKGTNDDETEGEVSTSAAQMAEQLLALLPKMPPSTRLVLVDTKTLPQTNPILKQIGKLEGGFVKAFTTPEGSALQSWITQRAKSRGVQIGRQAADKLASAVGNDLRALDQELAKLAAYCNYEGAITEEAIALLVSTAVEASIFGLVDAVGLRQRQQALGHLHRLLADGANELYILTMLARQVRLLISVKELSEEEHLRADDILKRLRISHRFILEKLLRQVRAFQMAELEKLLNRLLEVDQAIKTGRTEGPLALEMLVLQSC